MSITSLLPRAQKIIIDSSPQILTAVGVVGTVTTAVLTARAAFRVGLDANAGHYEPLLYGDGVSESIEPRDLVDKYWKEFIPPAVTGTLTIVAILGANHVSSSRAAGLAAAYSLSEQAFAEYRAKTLQQLGNKKERAIRDDISQDRVSRTSGSAEVIVVGTDVLCFDEYTSRYFNSSMEKLKAAQNKINYRLNNNGYATLTDFYNEIDLGRTAFSDEVGWTSTEQLELGFAAALTEEEKPCLAVSFRVQPVRDYYQFH